MDVTIPSPLKEHRPRCSSSKHLSSLSHSVVSEILIFVFQSGLVLDP
jgi:hypothetical protein